MKLCDYSVQELKDELARRTFVQPLNRGSAFLDLEAELKGEREKREQQAAEFKVLPSLAEPPTLNWDFTNLMSEETVTQILPPIRPPATKKDV